ncbi:glycosyltransferase family 39 protein [Fontivita pretiosa]|uniref:glycosyltransferase family 39 protein n=1 Tax=Fontivita pretiosa TaxID=2989684 RepID=UPI003D178C7D
MLLLILAVGAALRIARIDFDSLSFDEQWHLELSTGRGSPHVRLPEDVVIPDAPAVTSLAGAPPWYSVWTNMDFVVHPPLYCTLLRIWREAFGEGDIAARSFSIVCSLVAIALLFVALRMSFGLGVAFWAASILAAAPTQVLLAQQVRGYMLLAALGMGAIVALLGLERGARASLVAAASMALCVLGMMLTHYFAIGAAAAMGVWVLLRLRGAKLRYAITCLFIAAVVYLIIWGPFLWRQRDLVGATADPWLVERSENHLVLTLDRLAKWPLRFIVDPGEESAIGWLGAVVLVAPLFVLGKDRRLQLWMLWLAGTLWWVACLDLLRGTRQLQFVRYVSLAAPAVAGLIAALAARLPRPLHHATPALIVLIALACWKYAYVSEEPDWRKLGQIIDQHVHPGEAIVFYHGTQAEWFDEILYLGSAHYSRQFPRTIVRLSRPASPQLVAQLPGETAWLVSWQLGTDVSNVLPGTRVIERYEVPNLAICTRVRIR